MRMRESTSGIVFSKVKTTNGFLSLLFQVLDWGVGFPVPVPVLVVSVL